MDFFTRIVEVVASDKIIVLAIYAVFLDTVFGILRAARYRKLNSSIGIDGMIRKAGMVFALVLLVPLDIVCNVNLIGFLPETARDYLNISSVGISEFFAVLFIAFETVSILKNMSLCGLPVKGIWNTVYSFLQKYTSELPDDDEMEEKKE